MIKDRGGGGERESGVCKRVCERERVGYVNVCV